MNLNKKEVLGLSIANITMEQAVDRAFFYGKADKTHAIYTPNAEIAMMAYKDHTYRDILNRGDLVIPDGAGVVLASRIVKQRIDQKVAGYDLVVNILQDPRFAKHPIFLLGAKPGVPEKAAAVIRDKYPHINICGMHHGYFSAEQTESILKSINDSNAHILLVGLGAPAQERWIDRHRKQLHVGLAIGVGGAIDGLAGVVKRAPGWMIRIHLEWLYRLIKQPKRLLRMMNIPCYLKKALLFRISTK